MGRTLWLRTYSDKSEAIRRYRAGENARKAKLRAGGNRTYLVTLYPDGGDVKFRLNADELQALFIEYPGTTELWQVFETESLSVDG